MKKVNNLEIDLKMKEEFIEESNKNKKMNKINEELMEQK